MRRRKTERDHNDVLRSLEQGGIMQRESEWKLNSETEHVIPTRKETLKLVSSLGVARSETSESPSCFSTCTRRRMTCKRSLEHSFPSLEVLEP